LITIWRESKAEAPIGTLMVNSNNSKV
jgi:hypothetical protein